MRKNIVSQGRQADLSMANTSASILRQIVASVFGIKTTSVVLSGEISPDRKLVSFSGHSWARMKDVINLWGFSPQRGFISVAVPSYWSNNGETVGDEPMELHELIKEEDDFVFFLLHEDVEEHNHQDWESWTLYKAPDFREHWAKVQEKDIARWEAWLEE
jgi:hypothetical protein